MNTFYLGILYLVQILSSFSLETFIGINYFDYKNDLNKLKSFIGTIMITLIILGLIVISIFSVGGDFFFKLVFQTILKSNAEIIFYPWGLMTVFSAVFTGFLKTYSSLLINQQRPIRFFWINILNFSFTMIISISLLFAFPYTLVGPMWGRLIPTIISFATIMFFIIKEYNFKFNSEYLKGMKAFCLPMFFCAVFIWIVGNIDRYVIEYFLKDVSLVGVFDLAIKCTLVIDFLQVGLVNTIHPKVFNIWKDNNFKESTTEVNRYYNSLSALTLILIPLILIFVPLLFPIVVKNSFFYQIYDYLPILCMGFATRVYFYLFLAPIYFFKQTKVLPKVFLFSAIFQIVSSAILVKYFGLMGAVWANFIIKPIQALFLYFESRKIFKFKFNKMKLIYLPLFFIIMVICSEILFYHEYLLQKSICILVITSFLIYIVYKKELKMLILQILRKGKYIDY
ncbi:MAG TPA: polysaccharide biosynthesis C-terminal domain-containing protein [Bacteroidales bacterium]|nr:polysaccharide biosynthesis C-terminal domain-containing protein [Bacteroidales bacterium]